MRLLSFVFAFLCLLPQLAGAQAVIFAGGGSGATAPSSIGFTGTTIVATAASGTFVGTLSTTGGVGPYTYTVSNSKFQIVGNQVQRSASGTLTAGVPESLNFTSTDSLSNSTNTATNGQGPFSVSVTSSGATTLTQIKFVNPNAGSTGTNFITNEVGLAFHDGDITNGCTSGGPQFVDDATTTSIPFSESVNPICYPDGSLWFASFIFRDPVAILGSSSAVIDVQNGGSFPSASSRTLADFTAGGLDLNSKVSGLDSQLSGTWESELSQGITANTNGSTSVTQGYGYHYMTGAAGEVWRVQADYRQSGASHGQLEGWWYIASLQNATGGLAGIRYLVRTTAPWYDVASPAQNYWSFATWGDYNGASLVHDNWTGHEASIGFDWAGASTKCGFQGPPPAGTCFTVTSGTPAWEYGNLIRLFTTGSLPTGLSTATSYYVQNGDYEPYHYGYSTTQLSISTSSAVANGYAITPSSTCSGTCTAVSYPYITPFGSLYDAQSNGTWNYIQGNGSIATDSGVRVIPNNVYTRGAKLIPPFCFTCFTITEPTAFAFSPMTSGPLSRAQNSTGERPDIAPMHAWGAIYWFNQTANDEETVRTIGLSAGGGWPINMRSANASYYGSLPVVNNKSYSNMSPYSSTIQYAANNAIHGMTAPQNVFPQNISVQFAGWTDNTMSHSPDFEFPAFIMTGEPEYMDMVDEFGDQALTNITNATGNAASVGATNSIHGTGGSTARNSVISGTTYYGTLLLSAKDLLRADAWPRRNEVEAAWMVTPENASYHTYFNDLEQNTTNAANAFVNLYGSSFPWVTNNGMWYENSGSDCTGTDNAGCGAVDSWAMGYFLSSWNYSMALVPSDTNISTFVNYISLWFPHVDATFGTPYVGTYEAVVRQSPNEFVTPFVTSDTNVVFQAAGMRLAWTNTNPSVFTVSNNLGGYTPTVGDTIYWNPGGATVPGGMSYNTQYFVCNVSGNNFNLSATSSPCTGIQTSNTGTNQTGWYFYSTSVSGTNHYLYAPLTNIGSGYSANALGALNWSAANGISGVSTAITHLNTLITNNLDGNYPLGYDTWPVYAFQSSY